jgi:hypothetical protein
MGWSQQRVVDLPGKIGRHYRSNLAANLPQDQRINSRVVPRN